MSATLSEVAKPAEAFQPNSELARQLEQNSQAIDWLRQRVTYLESFVPAHRDAVAPGEVKNALEQVTAIARELFPQGFQVEDRPDLDVEGERYFEFSVPVYEKDLDSFLKKHSEWHSRLCKLPVNVRYRFALTVDAQE